MIHPIPYIRGVPEYAVEVRKKFRELEGRDFLLAVDLPHGLESEVMKAVKNLPKASLIIDTLKRGVLVIPSCASVEAVRSFLETGTDCYFIDASLPITGRMEEWRRFVELCREFGSKEIIERAEEYGIDLSALLQKDLDKPPDLPLPFMHIVGNLGISAFTGLTSPTISEYLEARQRYMAMRLQELIESEMDIVFVCSLRHYEKVMEFLNEPVPRFDDSFRLPTVTCRIKEEDLQKISPEIPYFVSLYELWREEGFSRREALFNLFTARNEDRMNQVHDAYHYSMNLALTDGQLYPDLFNIITSAKYAGDNTYAKDVLEKASGYPYADKESNCRIWSWVNYDFETNPDRTITIETGEQPDWSGGGGRRRKKNPPPLSDLFNFVRTAESREAELEFMHYLRKRYVSLKPSGNFASEEFQSGFKDGLDCRTTLRYRPFHKVYISEQELENHAAYVVNYGGEPTWRAYFDTHYSLVGAASRVSKNCRNWVCFAAFLHPPVKIKNYIHDIDICQPIVSCLNLALKHSDQVHLFTDTFEDKDLFRQDMHRIRIHALSRIPTAIREPMRWFYIKR